jgi:hypothetical protein
MIFVTERMMTFLLKRPIDGAFLFVLYVVGQFLCHRFMAACYDFFICEVT